MDGKIDTFDARPRTRGRWRRVLLGAVAAGVVVIVGVGALVVRDIARIDPTSGGYDAPYHDYTGQPIDWSAHRSTDSGFRDDGGVVLETSLDCTTGQIRAHLGPLALDYRKLSDRAIAIHKPHVACVERGFEPEWDYPRSDLEGIDA